MQGKVQDFENADQENTGGVVCKCRFHKGVTGANEECNEVYNNAGGGLVVTDTKEPDDDGTYYLGLCTALANHRSQALGLYVRLCI